MSKYSLKPIETQLLQIVLQQQQALLSNTLSFIALERLAIQVTPNTRFTMNEDMTEVDITEDTPTEDTGIVSETPKEIE